MCSLNLIILILIAYKLNIPLFDCKHFTNYDTFKVHRRAERLHCRFRPIHCDCDLIFLNVFHRFGFQLPSTSYVIVNVIAAMTITEAKFVTGIWAGSVTRSFCHRLCRCLYQSQFSSKWCTIMQYSMPHKSNVSLVFAWCVHSTPKSLSQPTNSLSYLTLSLLIACKFSMLSAVGN